MECLSRDGPGTGRVYNSGVQGYSDIGGGGGIGLFRDCQSNCGLQSGGQTQPGTTGHE